MGHRGQDLRLRDPTLRDAILGKLRSPRPRLLHQLAGRHSDADVLGEFEFRGVFLVWGVLLDYYAGALGVHARDQGPEFGGYRGGFQAAVGEYGW